MSDNGTDGTQGSDESYSGEELNTDTGSYSLDDEDQLSAEDTLVDRGLEDSLDEGYAPPDRARGSLMFGTTAWEQSQDETIEQRIKQEVPDPDSAYGAPDNESGMDRPLERVGGDDPDAIDARDDFIGDAAARTGRLVAPDEGAHSDEEKDLIGSDVGFAGGAASAEEAAMHVEGDRPEEGLDNDGSDELRVDDPDGMHSADSPTELADLDGITDLDD
ncbi:MAG: DUF5709 domain-containing protein [Actinomycetota bacterium]|nr:DUF5709 domain-containing protein [Actinomycetota bacterium]